MGVGMRKVVVSGCVVAVLGAGIALPVGVASAAVHVQKVKPFVITKIKPNPVKLTITGTTGTTTATTKVHWKGTATFPMTLTATPEPGCTTSSGGFTFTCNPHSITYASGSKNLVYSATCSVSSTSAGSHSGVWDLTITDANGRSTPAMALTENCSWG
jgi:hypothetical protein